MVASLLEVSTALFLAFLTSYFFFSDIRFLSFGFVALLSLIFKTASLSFVVRSPKPALLGGMGEEAAESTVTVEGTEEILLPGSGSSTGRSFSISRLVVASYSSNSIFTFFFT